LFQSINQSIKSSFIDYFFDKNSEWFTRAGWNTNIKDVSYNY